MFSVKKSIIRTIIYADIFNYPLTIDEIYKYLITNKSITKAQIYKEIQKIKVIDSFRKHFFLKGKKFLVQKRLKKEKESDKKLLTAKKAAFYLSFIPSVLLIGLSGNLAMKNAQKNDDIDFFIICKKGTIWISRLLAILLLKLLRLHRSYNNADIENKICLNMFIDQSALDFFSSNKNLYTAHEIVQLMPLFKRKNIYQHFLNANRWVIEYLPNSLDIQKLNREFKNNKIKSSYKYIIVPLLNCFIVFIEFSAKKIQLLIMNKHKTTETITNKFLAFHPIDHKDRVLKLYKKRLEI